MAAFSFFPSPLSHLALFCMSSLLNLSNISVIVFLSHFITFFLTSCCVTFTSACESLAQVIQGWLVAFFCDSVFQLGVILSLRVHLTISRDIFDRHCWWVEARDAAERPDSAQLPTALSSPKCNNAEAEKPYSRMQSKALGN